MKRSALVTAFIALVFVGVFLLANWYPDPQVDPGIVGSQSIAEYIVENFEADTGARNAVAAIYLNYRVYDTLFEALLLLIAVVGIMHFFKIGLKRDRDG